MDYIDDSNEEDRKELKEKWKRRREQQIQRIDRSLDKEQSKADFTKAVKHHRKIRKKASKEQKKREKRLMKAYRKKEEKINSEEVASDEDHDDTKKVYKYKKH